MQKRLLGSIDNFAVILVDMQKRFIENLRHGEANRIIPKQLAVLKYCLSANTPIIVLEFKAFEYGATIEILLEEAKKNPNFYLISKYWHSGFEETDLDNYLKLIGAKNFFLMGINADFCVRSTARDAIRIGYKIITSNEVISGQSHHRSDNNSDPVFFCNNISFDVKLGVRKGIMWYA